MIERDIGNEGRNATQRRSGWAHCFDCFYGKPADGMGREMAEHGIEVPR